MKIIKENVYHVVIFQIVLNVQIQKDFVTNVKHPLEQIQMEIVFYAQIHNIGKMEFVKQIWKDVSIK